MFNDPPCFLYVLQFFDTKILMYLKRNYRKKHLYIFSFFLIVLSSNRYYTFRKGNYDLVTNAHSPYGRGYEGVNDE